MTFDPLGKILGKSVKKDSYGKNLVKRRCDKGLYWPEENEEENQRNCPNCVNQFICKKSDYKER